MVSTANPDGSLAANITGLAKGTVYKVSAYATNLSGTAYGNEFTFTTIDGTVPTVTAGSISANFTSATINGLVLANGADADISVEYGITSGYGLSVVASPAMVNAEAAETAVTANITGLLPNTTYYYRLKASNEKGISYGAAGQFTTLALPTLSIQAATEIKANSAKITGAVLTEGGAPVTARGFVYATTAAPTTANFVVDKGAGVGNFEATFADLLLATTYYVRAFATTTFSTTYGPEVSFTTLNSTIESPSTFLGNLITTYGQTSSAISATITSIGLTSGITVTSDAPQNYELSTNGIDYAENQFINLANAAAATVYVRVKATAVANNALTGSVILSSTGATIKYITIPTSVVSKAVLTYHVNPVTKLYGEPVPTFEAQVTGFVNQENLAQATTGVLHFTTTATAQASVGIYPVLVSGLNATNYTFAQGLANDAALSVEPKPISVVAIPNTKVYGSSDPLLSYTFSPNLLNGDVFSGMMDRIGGEQVGTYAIQRGSLAINGNYTINFQEAALSIEKAMLTVTAQNNSVCAGSSLPRLTAIYDGFKFGETESALTTKAIVSSPANANRVAGVYSLVPSAAVANNYNFNYVNGNLTVLALPVVQIVADTALTVYKGTTLKLQASGGATYAWDNAEGIVNGANTALLTVRPLVTTTYNVVATSAAGCSQTKAITITVLDELPMAAASNIMSPNGDGKNDAFVIKHIETFPNSVLRIFDSAGRLLYSKKGYDNTWDGTLNGSPLAKGTYFYVLDLGNNKAKRTGFISIVRD